MSNDMYSVDQVADLLGLHVRTVRGYIRSGRLRATRIGKQYRIARADLDTLTGRPASPSAPGAEVSSVVRLDGVDRAAADRLGTLVLAGVNTNHDPDRPLRVQTVHDEERHRMTIVILGDLTATADLLRLLDGVLGGGNGLLGGGERGRD
ncbi:helix-turn-helix domain-containing protein [Micromonospora tulbaghiae]|uniref:DNA binding domain-containing protein, excisionase family n=2 Tax=Micromonospora tulbaghiae TaxID=479978 RepID=A0ABY0KTK6_9ACTN|nr:MULTISPECIES: helix-turn-helix domain-containing protein [Micromonospora]MDX5459006.1 helix-turn-helix domain-containing protein [Micromonospora tulbaghiae]SCF10047.1 DNA binding domain-containing protein, excisionase family [Micromonospora tulbaghiae]